MVGREQELAAVLQSLADPEVRLTLVTGEAGIGKSRLVTESVAVASQRLTLAGGCLPMRHALPLLPVVDALDTDDVRVRRSLARAVRLLPAALRPHVAGVMPRSLPEEVGAAEEVRRDQLFLACEALLRRAAEERPVTLAVEDIHWADPDTLDLLTYLAGAPHTTQVHLLVTCRADDSPVAEHVTEWLDLQRRSGSVHEVRLRPLGADDTRRLVAELPRPDGADVQRLATEVFARGQGNPFFTEQLVASAADRHLVPRRLASLLATRVRAATPPAREVLTALAILGRPVPVPALRLVTGQDEVTCLAAVRELEMTSLVVRKETTVRPRHALLNETLLEELPGLPASYHHRVAEALESLEDPSTLPEVAEHLRLAGDEKGELRAAQLAAQRAWDLGAYADAARLYQRVTTLHARHPEEGLVLAELEVVRRVLRALDMAGARREATAVAERALVDFADWPDLVERLALLTVCARLVNIQDPERGQRILDELLPQFEALPPSGDHANVLDRIAAKHLERGDCRTALPYAEKALAVARAAGDLRQQALALARMSACSRRLGDRGATDRHAAQALQTAMRCEDRQVLLWALTQESDNRLKYAEYDAAVRSGSRGIALAAQNGLSHSFHAQLLVSNAAEGYLALGRTEEVGRLVDVLTDQPLRPDDDVLGWLRAHADLRRGDPGGALARLLGERGLASWGAATEREEAETLAYVLLWNGRVAEALEVVIGSLPAASVGDESQDAGLLLTLGARAAADLAQDGDLSSAAEALATLEDSRASMSLDPFTNRVTLPRAAADGRQWEAERSRADGHGDPDLWREAAQGWEALSMPHDAAYCWWRTAEALSATGAGKNSVRDRLHVAHRLAAEHLPLRDEIVLLAAQARIPILDGASAPEDDPARSRGLTAQETKVLRLLAAGLTNGEIGTALYISPKTASIHVSNILRKLEVTNRTEAAAWALRHGLASDT